MVIQFLLLFLLNSLTLSLSLFLSVSCAVRSGRSQMEGQAHLARAIAHDNMQQYAAAADCYRRFLSLGRKLGDTVPRLDSALLAPVAF